MKILVIDIETTGLYYDDSFIVEIAAVELNLKNGKIKKKFNYLICEDGCFIDSESWIFENSDLKYEDVMDKGKSIEKIRKKLQRLLSKYICTAYNKNFDFGFLRDRGFVIENEYLDPMIVLVDVLKIPFESGYKWPSVQEVIDYIGMDVIEEHRALSDAKVEANIIYLWSTGKIVSKVTLDGKSSLEEGGFSKNDSWVPLDYEGGDKEEDV